MAKIIGVYKITSPSNKIYIGQSRDVKRRKNAYKRHKAYKGQPRLGRSIEKYGWENHKFEIIEECLLEELNIKERYWQDLYEVIGEHGLNCILTKTAHKPAKISPSTRKKMSDRMKGKGNPMYGKKHSEETRKKISENLIGVNSGKDHSLYGKTHSRNKKGKDSPNWGKKMSKEVREKMSRDRKGIIRGKEARKNIANGKIGGKNPNAKLVLDTNTGIFYTSIREASDALEICYGHLKNVLKGKYKNNTGYVKC